MDQEKPGLTNVRGQFYYREGMGAKSLTVSFERLAGDITCEFEQQEWGQEPGDGRESTPVGEMNREVPEKVTTRKTEAGPLSPSGIAQSYCR